MRSRSIHAYLGTFDVLVAIATLIFLILYLFTFNFRRQKEWSKYSLSIVYMILDKHTLQSAYAGAHIELGRCERSIQMGSAV